MRHVTLAFRILVLFLAVYAFGYAHSGRQALAQGDPALPAVAAQPKTMAHQPPANAHSFDDFVPPNARVESAKADTVRVDTANMPIAASASNSRGNGAGTPPPRIPVHAQADTAINVNNGQLGIIIEKGTFDTPATIVLDALAVTEKPSQRMSAQPDSLPLRETGAMLKFQVEALDQSGNTIPEFEKQVRLVVDLREYGFDLDENGGTFYLSYEDEEQPGVWHEIPVEQYGTTGLISGDTAHFSNWEAGWRPDMWTLQWQPPAPDEFTGAAVYQYPLNIPPGRNGLTPSLALSYSSAALRGLDTRGATFGSVATGWQLSDISITRTGIKLRNDGNGYDYPSTFRLTINGAGGRLISGGNGLYYVEDMPHIRVHSYSGYWTVEDGSGTTYRLGYTANSETRHSTKGPASGDQTFSSFVTIAWHVDTITDAFGNQINYQYTNHERVSERNPLWLKVKTLNSNVTEISYNFAGRIPDSQLPPPSTVNRLRDSYTSATKLYFTYDGSGFLARVDVHHGNQATAMRRYVIQAETRNHKNIEIGGSGCEALDSDGSWGGNTYTRVINSIKEQGWDNQQGAWVSLPATTFNYSLNPHYISCIVYDYLSSVDNGYGGHTTFQYASDNRGRWKSNSGSGYLESTEQYVVSRVTQSDGINPPVTVDYAYDERCYDQKNSACAQPENDTYYGIIAGHGKVTVTRKGFNNELLSRSINQYHVDIDKLGRPYHQESGGFNGSTYVRHQSVDTTYQVEAFISGVADTRFTYAHTTISTQYSGSNSISTHVVDSYQAAHQGGQQWGKLTGRNHFSDGVLDRHEIIYYHANTNSRIIVPWVVGAYDASWEPIQVTLNQYDYSTNNPDAQTITKGLLTLSRSLLLNDPIISGGNTRYKSVDAGFGYDVFGNLTTTTRYTDYGEAGHNGAVWNHSVLPSQSRTATTAYGAPYYLYPVSVDNGMVGHPSTTFEIYGFNGALDGFQTQPGLLKQVTDPNGVTVKYEYDPFGRLHAVYDEYAGDGFGAYAGFGDADRWNGNPVTLNSYWDNSWNNGTQWLDPAHADSNPNNDGPFLISQSTRTGTFPNPGVMPYTGPGYDFSVQTMYDGFGRAIQTRQLWAEVDGQNERRELISTTTYNAQGQVSCQTTPFDVPFYTDRGGVWPDTPFVADSCGSKPHTTTIYDAQGRPTEVIAPDNSSTRYYHGILSKDDLNSSVVNSYNDVPDYRNPDSSDFMPNELYHAMSVVTGTGDDSRATTQFSNVRGQMVYMTELEHVDGNPSWSRYATTTYSYDLMGNLTDVRDELWDAATLGEHHTQMEYDALGRKTSMDDPDMGHWEYAYDAAGNLSWQTDANDDTLCFDYDKLNRLTQKRESVLEITGGEETCTMGNVLATYGYDPANGIGQLGSVSWGDTPTANKDTFTYDTLGRMSEQVRKLDGQDFSMKTLTFDSLNRPLTVQYPDMEVVTLTYDREGENSLQAGSNMLVNDIRYNAHGQMTVLDRGSAAVPNSTYNYFGQNDAGGGGTGDSNFRLQTITHDGLLNFAYQYDTVGNITRIDSGSDVQVFGYDHLNRLTSVSNSYTNNYTYNEIGNMIEKGGVTYGYSPAQPHAVTSVGNDTFTYDDNGNMTMRTDGSDFYYQEFDVENRLVTVDATIPASATFEDTFATKNSAAWVFNGNQTVPTNLNGDSVVRNNGTNNWNGNFYRNTYSVSSGERVQVEFQVTGNSTAAHFALEATSPAGYNRWAIIATNRLYVQYRSADTGSWVYPKTLIESLETNTWYVATLAVDDDNGFYLEVYKKDDPSIHGSYHFDGFPAGQNWRFHHWIYRDTAYLDNYSEQPIAQTRFSYDASGQRVMTVEPDGTTIYTPFPAYEKEVKGGTVIERSTYRLAGQAIATRVSGDPIAGNNGLFYIHSDHLGSTSTLSDENGAQVGTTTRYTPFGDYRTGGQSDITDRGFTGHRENRGIGLTYMNARYYLPSTGRFLSADTIVPDPANPQSFNRYSYVLNSPLKYTDPSGHCAEYGDDACWSLYDQIIQICPECYSAIGLTPFGMTLDQFNYSYLKTAYNEVSNGGTYYGMTREEYISRDQTSGGGIPAFGFIGEGVQNAESVGGITDFAWGTMGKKAGKFLPGHLGTGMVIFGSISESIGEGRSFGRTLVGVPVDVGYDILVDTAAITAGVAIAGATFETGPGAIAVGVTIYAGVQGLASTTLDSRVEKGTDYVYQGAVNMFNSLEVSNLED